MSSVVHPDQARDRLAETLPRWSVEEGHLVRVYGTGGWRVSMLLAGAVAFLAEAANHHPELLLTPSRVTVRLISHDAGGITERDLELARRIERLAVEEGFGRAAFPHAPPADRWIR